MYIADNLKSLRKGKDLTQEEAAEMLGVSAQSVSKWERGETMPDITLLPALANLYKVSVDALIGMDKLNDDQTKHDLHAKAYNLTRDGDYQGVISLYGDALKLYPNDAVIMHGLALVLALSNDTAKVEHAIDLCERALAGGIDEKARHTARAALCFMYLKAGRKEKALAEAKNLPHIRESREMIAKRIDQEMTEGDVDAYLRFIILGKHDEQDIIEIDFGIDMVVICTEHGLLEKIKELREEIDAACGDGWRKLPTIRVRDNIELAPERVRVRCYADHLLDKEFNDPVQAVDEVIAVLRGIAKANP